ncbi:alpha/beta hydrolase [Mycolicibacterium madagascariense]|nr:alpha/beta hydrolase [Mycolicibacterium madagascariense]MCV7012963.1 alpha/beta fold hydrolase [Mycolicibacterium madagascariense]
MSWFPRGPVRRWTSICSALVVVVASGSGCATTVQGKSVASPQNFSDQTVSWKPCHVLAGGDAGQLPDGAQCGKITVPIDYAKPQDGTANLALIRFPATGKKIGSLVINPGGPGESGVDAAVSIVESLPSQVRESFDLVGFDPRGVASSTPTLRCNTDAEADAERADPQVDYSPAGVAHIEDTEKKFVQRCVDKMGKEFLANVGTVNVAKDLDVLRGALGDAKLTYLGYSYGTAIGSAYAEAYPDKVRAMILDGAVDPDADPIQSNIDQAAGFQKAFNDYAADCAKDASCPLGTDPAKINDVYHQMVNPLVAKPAITQDPRGLSYSDAITGTIMALYTPGLWKHLTDGLTELSHGHGDTLLKLADAYSNRDEDGHYSNSSDAQIAINCVDEKPVTDRAKVIDEDRQLRQVAPFMAYGQFTGDAPLDDCAFWPVPPTGSRHVASTPGLPPVLVVSTTHDPATPYQAGVDLAKELGGRLLTFDGTQHTVVFQGNTCVDGAASTYLTDLTLPAVGTTC